MSEISATKKYEGWTFLTNHFHVIMLLYTESDLTVRELALRIGITERSVQRIVTELVSSGAMTMKKSGRCNTYDLDLEYHLRHPLESHQTVGSLLKALVG
ncbi:MarR family transcriptional regulator [Akkermansiaceae bacterium]|nr:MarR family transcriptional regulator [Akkermansiaceae bacterium]